MTPLFLAAALSIFASGPATAPQAHDPDEVVCRKPDIHDSQYRHERVCRTRAVWEQVDRAQRARSRYLPPIVNADANTSYINPGATPMANGRF
jgi:hypothetical protein